ncbi:hypothetical protein L596_023791 [Steinernema carpocapsae]|uniref:Uncharacterized protein n=1 Tax=Steinernema carpocapsae TaxID=34508 RepID=A0A4U5MEQ7_STECR|nr:hypothetical protein L596_023791 [Steinernema carpocapsae]
MARSEAFQMTRTKSYGYHRNDFQSRAKNVCKKRILIRPHEYLSRAFKNSSVSAQFYIHVFRIFKRFLVFQLFSEFSPPLHLRLQPFFAF